MGILREFREFAVKGSVVDLAVGVIIGAAFNKIVDSLVKDVIMPLVSVVTGDLDFSSKFVVLGRIPEGVPRNLPDLVKAGVPVFAWGSFVTVVVNFLILAFVIFLMVQQINRLRHRHAQSAAAASAAAPPSAPPEDIVLLREIRDSLRK
ncbi:MAG TPA: large conductance mechanosensitive channel protein MscL [Ramlibacter sp.]|uniref:large conductance mechanosensitive channel protein MscL n=1 Tax=Ramlibacter sp. TaxID=1917967 RepID=UPI002D709425|nr:large conductance mechanosensitive channel protein MscL [Ramlibacter sp.]HZY20131.1 large conductance mechanosensitive channel protein MscL [Ramlibacter sp.]